jgi:hypothetical protein
MRQLKKRSVNFERTFWCLQIYQKVLSNITDLSSYLYLSPPRIRNPLTPPSSNRGNLNIFLKTLQKTFQFKLKLKFNFKFKLKLNFIHKFPIQIPYFKSPATFQVNKKVNKKVNIKN